MLDLIKNWRKNFDGKFAWRWLKFRLRAGDQKCSDHNERIAGDYQDIYN